MPDPGDRSRPVATGATFWELLSSRVALSGDQWMLADEHGRTLTWRQFQTQAERVAAGLQQLGIGPGSVVSWQLPTRIETIVLSLALSRLGAVQNPIIHLYRKREVSSLLRTTGADWFVQPGVWKGFDYRAMADEIVAEGRQITIVDGYADLPEADPAVLPPPPTDGSAVRWLYATSGTTSEPKAVRHTDGTLIAGGTGISLALGAGADDVSSICYPFAHIGGPDKLVMMLRDGVPAVVTEAFVPAETFPLLARHGVTITGGSTAHYLAYLAYQAQHPGQRPVPSLRVFSGGGAPKPPELYWRTLEHTGVVIRHGYGMTECPMIANGRFDDTDEQLANTEGRPVEGCEVRIVDDDGEPVAPGVDGEILVRGAMLAKGYLDEEQTRQAFDHEGWFRTGDRGHVRPDGHMVLTGRSKEMIIRKGENISPREIEDVLMTHPAVAAVAVIGLPDPDRGERVCAVIETAVGAEPITFGAMSDHCRQAGLMTQKVPEQLELLDALPRNPTLKVLKRVLVERFSHTFDDREVPA